MEKSTEEEKCTSEENIVDVVRKHMEPGFKDTWQLILVKKGHKQAVRVHAIEEGRDLRKPFALSFSSHPGLAMLRGPKVHGMGEIMYIGDADSDKIVNVTVEQPGGGEDPLEKELRVRISKTMAGAKTPEEVVALADLIAEPGYKNTG